VVDAGKVYRRASAGGGLLDLCSMRLDAADPDGCISRQQIELVTFGNGAGGKRSRHDGAKTLYRKAAIDGETRYKLIGTRLDPARG
jgi:hypothetical protein